MPILEVRRHSMRPKPGDHLSQAGVSLARLVGETMRPTFDRVMTSTLPRAFETAIAMGYAPGEQVEWLTTYGDAVEFEVPYPQTFAAYAAARKNGWAVAAFAEEQAYLWREVVLELPEDGAALLVSHGGVIELGAIGCLMAGDVPTDFAAWGGYLSYCEGVRLHFTGDKCVRAEVLRTLTPAPLSLAKEGQRTRP